MTPSPGTIVRKAAAILRALARTHSSMGNARISKTRETRHQDMRNIHH
jgi:hypothetical protein